MARKKKPKQRPRAIQVVKQSGVPLNEVPDHAAHFIQRQDDLVLTHVKWGIEKTSTWIESGCTAIAGAAFLVLFQNIVTQIQAHPSQVREIIQGNAFISFLGILVLLLGILSLGWKWWNKHSPKRRSWSQVTRKRLYPLVHFFFSPLLSFISTSLFVILLVLVLSRPSWCPSVLCSPMSIINLPGVHDANLNLYFQNFQGDTFVLSGDPTRTSVSSTLNERNPTTIHAVLLKNGSPSSLYRVVLVARSLHTGMYSIVIDQVALRIVAEPSISQPLNVWMNPSLMKYDTGRYGIIYRSEAPNALLPARYLQVSDGYTQLATNEADQLDIQIASYIPVDLKFQLQVTYHIGPDQKRLTLQLPQLFEVVFSSQSNWHSFSAQSGHFIKNK